MKFKIKETTLTDGSKVIDVDLFPNGHENPGEVLNRPMCIFSCNSKNDARRFFWGLERLIEKHTMETLEEI